MSLIVQSVWNNRDLQRLILSFVLHTWQRGELKQHIYYPLPFRHLDCRIDWDFKRQINLKRPPFPSIPILIPRNFPDRYKGIFIFDSDPGWVLSFILALRIQHPEYDWILERGKILYDWTDVDGTVIRFNFRGHNFIVNNLYRHLADNHRLYPPFLRK